MSATPIASDAVSSQRPRRRDTHFALGMEMHQSRPGLDDLQLRAHQVIRIYDIVFDYENLLGTDQFYRTLCRGAAFQRMLGTAEFHYLVGQYLAAREDDTGRKQQAAHRSAALGALRYWWVGKPLRSLEPVFAGRTLVLVDRHG